MFELLLQADKALADGSLDQAERTYWQLIDLDPSNAIAVAGLARVALERGDETSARTFADQALAIDPESIAARRVIDTIAHTGPTRGDDAMELPLLAAERLEAMSRRRATGPAGGVDRASDEGAAAPKAGGPRKVASGAAVENPPAGAGLARPGTKAVRASAATPAEPLRERRKAGRLAAAAAAAAAAAREPVHGRHEPHRAMPLGRRYFETAELKPTQVDEFSEAEMAAAIEAVDALEEPGVSSGRFPSQPGGRPKDDQSDLLGAVEATAPDESVALRLALMSDVAELDAAEREAAAYQDIENADDSFEAAEAMASSALHIQPRAPHETRPSYIVGAAHDLDFADDFDAAEAGAAESAATTRTAEADAEAASRTELEAEAAAATEAMAEAKAAAATEPEPAPVRRNFKIESESEPSEEAAEAQALREALAQVLAGEPADRSTGADAGAPAAAASAAAAAASAAAAAAASADTVPLDTAATTDTAEEEPSTEESSPESAPHKSGIFRRIRGN